MISVHPFETYDAAYRHEHTQTKVTCLYYPSFCASRITNKYIIGCKNSTYIQNVATASRILFIDFVPTLILSLFMSYLVTVGRFLIN